MEIIIYLQRKCYESHQKIFSMEKGLKIEKFKEYKPVRVSQELYEVGKVRFKMGIYGYRLLYALAQSLDYNQKDLFPEYGFDIQVIFKYLNINNNGRRYEILNEALNDIGENILNIKTYKKNGAIRWQGMAWITKYDFATDEKLLNIQVNEAVKPFLLNLKQYALIRPKDYLNLSTEYQNWFYPYLKNVSKVGKWRVSIEDLKQALFLENTDSYDPKKNKNATENFLKWVIGIQISQKAKLENQTATKAKRKPKLIEWDYTKDKAGNSTGTLYGITQVTDINVTASVEKTGRTYTHIIFFLSEKSKRKLTTNVDVETDLGKVQQKQKRTSNLCKVGDMFKPEDMPEVVPIARVQYYTAEQVKAHAKDLNMTIAVFLDKMRLKKMDDGRYYKEY